MIGTPNIMAKVSRSRRSCWTSLTMMARKPPPEAARHMVSASRARCRCASPHEMDEHVLERGLRLFPVDAARRGSGSIAASSASRSGPQTCSVAPKAAAAVTPGASRSLAASRSAPGPVAMKATRPDCSMISSAVPRAISSP